MPGESVDLHWKDFPIFFDWRDYPTEPFDICIWTSLPDQKMDNNNDRFCLDFPVNDREPDPSFFFTAFPNPSSTTTIEYALPPGHAARLRVFNSMGILMAEYDAVENGGSVALPKFPAGLYFVSLEVEGAGARTLKLVQM